MGANLIGLCENPIRSFYLCLSLFALTVSSTHIIITLSTFWMRCVASTGTGSHRMQLRQMVNSGSAEWAACQFSKIRILRAEVRESYQELKPRNRCSEQMPQVIWMLGQVWKPLHSANSILSVVNPLKTDSFQSDININTSLLESNESIIHEPSDRSQFLLTAPVDLGKPFLPGPR